MNPAASPAAPGAPLVILDNLTVSYRQHPALHHISRRVCARVAHRGHGAQWLGQKHPAQERRRAAAHSRRPGGRGPQVNLNRRPMAYLPQLSEIDRSFPINVHDCVLLGLWGSAGRAGAASARRCWRGWTRPCTRLVWRVSSDAAVGSLSSGQFQRVLFARLLVQDADLILLDEPFNAMDTRTTADLLALVQHWHQQHRTVIAVLHDEAQVRQHFPHTLLLARERVAWGPTADVLTDGNLQRARAMAEAWDDAAPICQIDGVSKGLTIPVGRRHQAPRTSEASAMDTLLNAAWTVLIAPFAEFAFMRRALVATLALALSAAPLGVFLTLRRMSLLGDALSHAVLPGVAIGFMVAGLSLPAMALGGVVAGLVVAGIAGLVSRFTLLREDASLAAIYLVALALGVTLISRHGTQLDLLHILFGSALGVDGAGLLLVAGVATVSVLALALMYRGLVLETFDPVFLNVKPRGLAGRMGVAPRLSDAGGGEPGGGLSDPGHADGRGPDDAARRVRAPVARHLARPVDERQRAGLHWPGRRACCCRTTWTRPRARPSSAAPARCISSRCFWRPAAGCPACATPRTGLREPPRPACKASPLHNAFIAFDELTMNTLPAPPPGQQPDPGTDEEWHRQCRRQNPRHGQLQHPR